MTAIVTEDYEHVRVITFARPEKRNAFNYDMYHKVAAALRAAAKADVRVVVLTGTGTAFTAGQDLAEMQAIAEGRAGAGKEGGFRELLDVVEAFALPLVAAVNGVAVGLGFTLLAHCDLVFMAEDARLRVPFAELGVPPEAGASYLLPLRMGWQAAAHALFTGDWVTATEAVEAGMAWRSCPPAELMREALATAAAIAARPPAAVREIKRLMLAARLPQVRAAREREEAAFAILFRQSAAD